MNAIYMDFWFSIVKYPKNWSVRKLRCYESIKYYNQYKVLRSILYANFKEYVTLAKAFSFCLAFLQWDLTWSSNVSLLLIPIRRSYSHLPLEMAITSILTRISCVEFERRCDFSEFAFRRLSVNDLNKSVNHLNKSVNDLNESVNHLNKIFDIFSRSCNTLFKFILVEWGVLSSA